MNKQEFYRSLSDIASAKKSFEILENLSARSIEPWVIMFGLPMEVHSIQYVHRVRSVLMSALSFYYGVKHLKGERFEVLGLRDLEKCKKLTKELMEFDIAKYKQLYSVLSSIN